MGCVALRSTAEYRGEGLSVICVTVQLSCSVWHCGRSCRGGAAAAQFFIVAIALTVARLGQG
eukprot:13973115-Alexandrium_andersonii.AAC.1